MSEVSLTEEGARLSDYEPLFAGNVQAGHSPTDAAVMVAEAYLDGKPRQRGKHKITWVERDAAFWSSEFLSTLPANAWHTEPLVLALARYMGQERVSNAALLGHIATIAPETVRRAIRYSGLVLQQHSPRRIEVDRLAAIAPAEFGEFVRVLDVFDTAYRERVTAVDMFKQPLAGLTPLELLVYASLFAFELLVPRDLLSADQPADPDSRTEVVWDAINDLLIWKLGSAGARACRLTESDIAKSMAVHLSPFLFPSQGGPGPREDLYGAFRQLLTAQMELNSFISRSADAFSYDDSIAFVLQDGRLEIVEHDPAARAAWVRNGERLARLQYYWFYRALDAFAASELATAIIGKTENHDANRFAYIKTLRTQLQLTEVYGLAESVTAETGLCVDLFQALLSLELMAAFFKSDFMLPYMQYLDEMGNSRMALGRLAFDGLKQPGSHNRFPITWSDRASKVANITGWTVSKDFPHGSPKAAEAILDFWTSDWTSLAARLHKGEVGLHPELFERPILKMGRYLFQLPWLVAIQNNASAAINNLRRIGGRRTEARDETRRIEEQLGKRFEEKGFRVQLNYQPYRTSDDDPGEVDLICARDGQVLVLEIKSTFLRRSQKDAWLHGTRTLRKAGLQLRRKVQAVQNALTKNTDLVSTLGIDTGAMSLPIRGWIVDTSIEHDHERFNGFLKVSLEEVLIALRDDRHLLNDPEGLFNGTWVEAGHGNVVEFDKPPTLYPDGFSSSRFVEVIESEAVWVESVH
ncbi:MAG: hypothetical protein U9Q19_00335 [Pseudomonadota bacterium]|nr:hypothetical protein [Pseudomonadota bacterium]